MSTTEERLARLEEGYTHLATKADLEALRGEVKALAGSFKIWTMIAAIVQGSFSALVSLALRSS